MHSLATVRRSRSLMFAGAQVGAVFGWLASGYEFDAESVRWARERGAETVAHHGDQRSRRGGLGADVIYTEVWASMGEEAEQRTKSHLPSLSGRCHFVPSGQSFASFCLACGTSQ